MRRLQQATDDFKPPDSCTSFTTDVPAPIIGVNNEVYGMVRAGTGAMRDDGVPLIRVEVDVAPSGRYLADSTGVRTHGTNIRVCFTRAYPQVCPINSYMYHVGVIANATLQRVSMLVPVPPEVWTCSPASVDNVTEVTMRLLFVEVQVDVAEQPNSRPIMSPYAGDRADSVVPNCQLIGVLAMCNPSRCNGTTIAKAGGEGITSQIQDDDRHTFIPIQPPPQESGGSGVPTGAVVGGVVGGLAVLGVVAAVVLLARKRRRSEATALAAITDFLAGGGGAGGGRSGGGATAPVAAEVLLQLDSNDGSGSSPRSGGNQLTSRPVGHSPPPLTLGAEGSYQPPSVRRSPVGTMRDWLRLGKPSPSSRSKSPARTPRHQVQTDGVLGLSFGAGEVRTDGGADSPPTANPLFSQYAFAAAAEAGPSSAGTLTVTNPLRSSLHAPPGMVSDFVDNGGGGPMGLPQLAIMLDGDEDVRRGAGQSRGRGLGFGGLRLKKSNEKGL